MANEQITDALAAFKTILASIDPSPQPVPTAVYQFPEDFNNEVKRAAIDYDDLPLLMTLNQVNVWNNWAPQTHGTIWHPWIADIYALLAPEVIGFIQEAESKVKYVPWLRAMQLLLYQNQGLSGNALSIGNQNYLFRYRVGNIGWIDTKVFWGVRFQIPVNQEHSRS